MNVHHFLLRNTRQVMVVWLPAAIGFTGAIYFWLIELRTNPIYLFVAAMAAFAIGALWTRWQRERMIREAQLPQFVKRKLRDRYPGWTAKDTELVERGLRRYFLACHRSQGQFIAMPSKAVDAAWHEFMMQPAAYQG